MGSRKPPGDSATLTSSTTWVLFQSHLCDGLPEAGSMVKKAMDKGVEECFNRTFAMGFRKPLSITDGTPRVQP